MAKQYLHRENSDRLCVYHHEFEKSDLSDVSLLLIISGKL